MSDISSLIVSFILTIPGYITAVASLIKEKVRGENWQKCVIFSTPNFENSYNMGGGGGEILGKWEKTLCALCDDYLTIPCIGRRH